MMILRRRMMGEAKDDYIQDGLIFWLDGINRGTSDSKKWVDLIGGQEHVTKSGNDATWGSNHLITPCLMQIENNTIPLASSSTFEIVFQEEQGSVNTILYLCRDAINTDGFGFGSYSNNYLLSNSNDFRFTIPLSTAPFGQSPYCFSYNGDRVLIINGNLISNTSTTDFYTNSTSFTKIATRGNGGKLYCIRKYNRKLTQEEMLYNQKVDNKRFNLGLNI